jgi:hypothetical protein
MLRNRFEREWAADGQTSLADVLAATLFLVQMDDAKRQAP